MDENKVEQQTENAETTAITAAPQTNLHPTMWNDNTLLTCDVIFSCFSLFLFSAVY